ncbi:hypothetical protein Q7P37_008695 [Cladosporium fusiforme]
MSDMKKEDTENEALSHSLTQNTVNVGTVTEDDAVFGEIGEGKPNYRNVSLFGTVAIMVKIMIGLGVLSIPSGFDKLGLIPGVICLVAIGVITTWASYVVGTFKQRHNDVYGIDDAGYLMFGCVGREVLAIAFCLCYIFVSGSGMLSISIAFNALSEHGACTAIFVAVAAIATFGLASIRTLGRIQMLAWVGIISILVAVFTVTIAVGVQGGPEAAQTDAPWVSDYKLFGNPSFAEASAAVSAFTFAYAGAPAFFPVVSEMRDPRQYTTALLICQAIITITYIVVGVVMYYYCGTHVASPALGSAGVLIKKICYGIALPGLLMSAVLCLHLSAKFIFVRILRNSRHLSSNSKTHWFTWLGCTFGTTLIAYIVASAIPVFDSLVSLIGALLVTLLAVPTTGCMWFYDHWVEGKKSPTSKWYMLVAWNGFVVVIGVYLVISGTYGSIENIIASYSESGGSAAWSCADNSNSS